MSEQVKIGQFVDQDAQRDAIHVAIAPVTTDTPLKRGQHVGFSEHGDVTKVSAKATTKVGIVDPFLNRDPRPGDRFFLFLYPNTVTGMRHHWQHPAFEEAETIAAMDKVEMSGRARRIVEQVAAKCGLSPEAMMKAAEQYVFDGEYTHMGNNESYGDVTPLEWKEFWDAYHSLTGKRPAETDREYAPFSCAC